MFIWVAFKENVKQAKDIVDNYRGMFKWRISAEAMEKLPGTKAMGKPHTETISSWSYEMEGHAKKCVERYCELSNKTTQQFSKVATPCIDDHQFKEEKMGSVAELSTVWSQIVVKCLYLARIGRPDIFVVCEQACVLSQNGQNLVPNIWRVWSVTFITHVNTGTNVMWETPQQCRLGLFQDSDFAGDVDDSKSTSGEFCAFSEAEHLYQ